MKDKLKKLLTVTHLNALMLVILTLLVAFPLFAPIVPAEYDKPAIKDATALYAGHELTYKIHSCRYVGDSVLTTITRRLVSISDKTLTPINLSADTLTSKEGCEDSTSTLIIPYSTPAGTYQLQVSGIYSVIPLRKPITVTATSDSFKINGATVSQDIEALINANKELQAQIQAQLDANPTTTPVQGSNSQQSTTNNSSNSKTTKGSGSSSNGLIPGLVKALGGGGLNIHF